MAEGACLPYLDIPFQHGSPSVLKTHAATGTRGEHPGANQVWRSECPDSDIRSTFIVGFPGETEAEFEELLAWLDDAQLDRVGCFKYSPVEGAAANASLDHVPPEVQEERYARFMERPVPSAPSASPHALVSACGCWWTHSTAQPPLHAAKATRLTSTAWSGSRRPASSQWESLLTSRS